MNPVLLILGFLLTSILAGILGACAMIGVMHLITQAEWAKANMLVALGSLITRSRENAHRAGIIAHLVAAVIFASLYNLAMMQFGLTHMPGALFTGAFLGVLHGIIMSLALVWVVCESHPLEEFQSASFAVGVAHLAGHVAYGAVVGLVIGILSTIFGAAL